MMRVRDDAIRELLDGGPWDDGTLRRNLHDIRRINGLLGWRAAVVLGVAREVRAARLPAFSLLDVASGSADIPAAIARWAARVGIPARIVASDLSPQIVAIAREQCASVPSLSVERQDALALRYPADSFDFALCTLALHHFAPDDAVHLLREMARVGRRVLVYDVQRARLAYLGVIALTRLLRMDPMTCHDAPATVRRAYSASELRALAERAGLRNARVLVRVPYRLVLTADGTGFGEREGHEASAKDAKEEAERATAKDAEDAEKESNSPHRERRSETEQREEPQRTQRTQRERQGTQPQTGTAQMLDTSRPSRLLRVLRVQRISWERGP